MLFMTTFTISSDKLVLARATEGVSGVDKLPSSSPPLIAPLTKNHGLAKRAADTSCKGAHYDYGILEKLERVCEDCYNLYRKPSALIECR